jgi:hypothetical protein
MALTDELTYSEESSDPIEAAKQPVSADTQSENAASSPRVSVATIKRSPPRHTAKTKFADLAVPKKSCRQAEEPKIVQGHHYRGASSAKNRR